MITIKDFAAQQGCSETIVYRHIRNHKEALGDRVQKTHGKTWLTDEGAEYIRSLMIQAPIVVSETSDLVKHLEEENKQLLQALNAAKDKIIELTEQNGQLAIEAKKTELLEADNAAKEKEKEILEGFIADAKAEIDVQKAQNANLSADNDNLRQKVAEAEKTAQEASGELERAKKEIDIGASALEKTNIRLCDTLAERDVLQEYVNLPWLKRIFTKPPILDDNRKV